MWVQLLLIASMVAPTRPASRSIPPAACSLFSRHPTLNHPRTAMRTTAICSGSSQRWQSGDSQTLTVTVTNVNEAPVITSNGGGDAASVSLPENTTTVTTVTATDPMRLQLLLIASMVAPTRLASRSILPAACSLFSRHLTSNCRPMPMQTTVTW